MTSRRNLLKMLPWGLAGTAFSAPPPRTADLKITRFVTHKALVNGRQYLFLEIETDGGIVGLGEGSLPARIDIVEKAIEWLEPHLVGKNPAGVEEHWDRIFYQASRWRNGDVLMTAQAAVDIALWDIEGKALGVSTARLLGGPLHRNLRVYYSHWETPVKNRTPEALARRAVETREQGWTAVKIIPQIGSNEADTRRKLVAELDAIRKAVGDSLDIGLELVERFSTRSAIELAHAVAPYKPMFLEEATRRENPKAMTELAEKSPVPLAGGEGLVTKFEFREFLEAKGAKIIQPDVIHCGGITEMKRIANVGELYGAELSPHMWYGPIAHAASLSVASVCHNFFIQEWDGGGDPIFQEATKGTLPRQKGGVVALPTAPGLGITVDFAYYKARFPYQSRRG
jgi:galactonate dehydratase